MAKGQKKISINVLEKVAKDTALPIVTEQWYGNELVIKPTLSLTEMLQFVNDVVSSCFDDQGEYHPEILDFAIGSNILDKYSNFSLPKNLENRYQMIYNTDAVNVVYSHINRVQYATMRSAIDDKIQYQCDMNSAYIRKSFETLINTLSSIQEKANGLFDGVETSDIKTFMNSISNTNDLDANKIVEAYLNQTAINSEVDE